MIYCTYIGGSEAQIATAIAVDAKGHAFVTGPTYSANFPTTNAVVYGSFNGSHIQGSIDPNLGQYPYDDFVCELETNGASLIYSTYLGGTEYDQAFGLAIDSSDNAYITGATYSKDYPVTTNAFQTNFASVFNIYVEVATPMCPEIASNGNTLLYSTRTWAAQTWTLVIRLLTTMDFLRLPEKRRLPTFQRRITFIRPSRAAQIMTATCSTARPAATSIIIFKPVRLPTMHLSTLFKTNGTSLGPPLYSTMLGSTNSDTGYGVAVDAGGNVYVVGETVSPDFPVSSNALKTLLNGNGSSSVSDGFLTKLSPSDQVLYSTFGRLKLGYRLWCLRAK